MVLYATSEEIVELQKKIKEIIILENNCISQEPALIKEKKKIMAFIDEKRGPSKQTRAEAIIFEIVNLIPHKEEIKYRYKPKTVIAYVEEECVLNELEKQNISIDQLLEGKISFAWLQNLNRLCNLPESKL